MKSLGCALVLAISLFHVCCTQFPKVGDSGALNKVSIAAREPAQSTQDSLNAICTRIASEYPGTNVYIECINEYRKDQFDQVAIGTCVGLQNSLKPEESATRVLFNCLEVVRGKSFPKNSAAECYEAAQKGEPQLATLCLKHNAH